MLAIVFSDFIVQATWIFGRVVSTSNLKISLPPSSLSLSTSSGINFPHNAALATTANCGNFISANFPKKRALVSLYGIHRRLPAPGIPV